MVRLQIIKYRGISPLYEIATGNDQDVIIGRIPEHDNTIVEFIKDIYTNRTVAKTGVLKDEKLTDYAGKKDINTHTVEISDETARDVVRLRAIMEEASQLRRKLKADLGKHLDPQYKSLL